MDIIKTTNLYKTVVLLAWPVVVRMSLNMVVNLVDMIMIGQLGANAIAAVGVSTQLFFTAIAAIAAFGVGTTTLVAQYTGAGDKAGAREVARQSLVFSALITFSLSVLAFIFARPLGIRSFWCLARVFLEFVIRAAVLYKRFRSGIWQQLEFVSQS